MHSFYIQRMSFWPCRCQEKFCLWLQNFKTSPSVSSAVCLLITLISLTISSAFLWLIKKLIDTVASYLVSGHCVHPEKSHFRQQHQCCHWLGERGSCDTASLSVPITSRGKRSHIHLIHLEGSLFQLQNFSVLTIIVIDVFLLQTYSAMLKQLSFCKENAFSSFFWKTAGTQMSCYFS